MTLQRRPTKLPSLKRVPPTWELVVEKHHRENDEIERATLSVQAFTKGEARAAFKRILKDLSESELLHLPNGFRVTRGTT